MAKVTIVITDKPDGGTQIEVITDPPVDKATTLAVTPAQRQASTCLAALAAEAWCRQEGLHYAQVAKET